MRQIQKSCKKITFLSVSCGSEEYIKLNNSRIRAERWIVKTDVKDNELPSKLKDFDVIPFSKLVIEDRTGQFVSNASYRHAARLNELVRQKSIDTRFVCILDPDFFLITPKEEIIEEMLEYNLGFHGASYFPVAGRKKIYDVPVAFCLFIDRAHCNIGELDFTPVGTLEDGTIADTGYKLYKDMKDGKTAHFLSAHPTYPHSLNIATNFHRGNKCLEFYSHNSKIFGVHLRSKIHLKEGLEKKVRISQDIELMQQIFKGFSND